MRFTTLSTAQDRALHELSQGRPIVLTAPGTLAPQWLIWAVDCAPQLRLEPQGQILISAPRAASLGLGETAAMLAVDSAGGADILTFLARAKTHAHMRAAPAPDFGENLIALAKQGRVLPAFYLLPYTKSLAADALSLTFADLAPSNTPPLIERQSTVALPFALGDFQGAARALLYTQARPYAEALALQFGEPAHGGSPPLVRLHSACLTGDIFGSLRCDCGPQLHEAMRVMAAEGRGCLLYLPQEGRDTGLKNKLRAYALQEAGLDTIDADAALGFEGDERDFALAGALLKMQGISQVRLLTNNPHKVAALSAAGIRVVERVALSLPAHKHNAAYLATKAEKAGHLL